MALSRAILLSAMAATVQAAIEWGGCPDWGFPDLQCANATVPLDYTSSNSTTNNSLTLQLARLPATIQPPMGSILLNFGGPGATSRSALGALGNTLLAMSGGHHDLVVFDPRGTGNTIPFTCYDDEWWALLSVLEQVATNESEVALGSTWASAQLDSQNCFEAHRDTGSLIGTAFVARDLISVVDLLEEDGLLRYWGFSYGTTLGATVSAMFPERIDRLILDGVQNPHEYYHSLADYEEWTDSDAVVSAIFETCVEMPDHCAMAGSNSAAELEQQFWDLVERVKFNPVIVGHFKVDYSFLKNIIAQALYDSSTWPAVAILLHGLFENENTPEMDAAISAFYPTSLERALATTSINFPLWGIHCSDQIPRADTLEEMVPVAERLSDISRIYGDLVVPLQLYCARWPFAAKERYTGDFNVKTAAPVLIVSTRLDAHTPLVSAYNISSSLEDSHVLVVDGYGHASLAVPSLCTIEKISAYFINGTMPEHGYLCEASAQPYSGITWDDIIGTNQTARRSISGGLGKSYVPELQSLYQ